MGRKGKAFCERPFALHRNQPEPHGCSDFDLILGSLGVVLFGSILLSHSKTINAKVVSFFNQGFSNEALGPPWGPRNCSLGTTNRGLH